MHGVFQFPFDKPKRKPVLRLKPKSVWTNRIRSKRKKDSHCERVTYSGSEVESDC